MEPFGLFQFLQNLLTKTEESEAFEPKNTEEKAPEESGGASSAPPPEPSPAQDAFLGFLSAHDRRAKNTKK